MSLSPNVTIPHNRHDQTHYSNQHKIRSDESLIHWVTLSFAKTKVYKKPSYRWGTARRGRASWNLV